MNDRTCRTTALAGFSAVAMFAAAACADTYFWTGQDGDWSDETK